MPECLIVGGGVIGLSLAYELARDALSVRVIDAAQPGREASWAGAGILPPACASAANPLEQLTALSNRLHAEWSEALRATTGVDNGYRRSGAVYLARTDAEARQLEQFAVTAHARKIAVQALTRHSLAELEPALRPAGELKASYFVPDECQLRNPRHLKALLAALARRGVEVINGAAAEDFEICDGRVQAVRTNTGLIRADLVCLTSGAWSSSLARRLGISLAIRPVRGQMVLLSAARQNIERIVNEQARYLVPRCDGRVLVGSTEEEAGFDRNTTAGAISDLLAFAIGLCGELATATVERSWAGLRPATADGLPYLGRAPGLENVFVAAGHFRSGLQLSTGTAVVMSQLIRGQRPSVDLSPFSLERSSRETSAATEQPRRKVPSR